MITNTPPNGGFQAFHDRGEENDTFATAISSIPDADSPDRDDGEVPERVPALESRRAAGDWSEWDVAGNGYKEFNYQLNENGQLVSYGSQPSDYLTM